VDLVPLNVKINTTESILGADISAETDVSLFKISKDQINSDKKNVIGADVEFGNAVANAHAGIGVTGIGAEAGAEVDLVSANLGPISVSVGLGVHTGAFVSPVQASTTILGTGISIGEKTGISILGTSVTVDVGQAIEKTVNHVVHGKNPHEKIAKKIHHTEHHLGVDVIVTTVETGLTPVKTEIKEIITVVQEHTEEPLQKEFREHVIVPVRHVIDSVGKDRDEKEKKENT